MMYIPGLSLIVHLFVLVASGIKSAVISFVNNR
jgi:hypothetical protein